ncbi:hypothetical protein NW766_001744 [Fusarium irregulare]|uniref:Uncharacterized protein n=1 Tax=Fusarium irregulare TaxID=2494466 RepID=A0A9W8UFN9_9HYPO|nr:hypothetical protein NW766_001744 [Fusarium irregulare]
MYFTNDMLTTEQKNGRYMVDIGTYRRFHKLSNIDDMTIGLAEEYLASTDAMSDSPPTDSFTLLLPPTTYGFGFHDKKWQYAADVVWDEHIFNMTMLSQTVKDRLKALELKTKRSRDVKASRGQGKVIELHSGPRIGRMMAAEALAESIRKPLYRLALHEVGVEPEQVENSIQEAFYLGGLWKAGMFAIPQTPTLCSANDFK